MISKCSRLKQRVVWGEGEQFLDFDILDTIFISNEARIRVDFSSLLSIMECDGNNNCCEMWTMFRAYNKEKSITVLK